VHHEGFEEFMVEGKFTKERMIVGIRYETEFNKNPSIVLGMKDKGHECLSWHEGSTKYHHGSNSHYSDCRKK
jgi:hypothetical protein